MTKGSDEASPFAEVPAALVALVGKGTTTPAEGRDIVAAKVSYAEQRLGRRLQPGDDMRMGIRADGSVVEYDRPTSDPQRRRLRVVHPRPRSSTLAPRPARPRQTPRQPHRSPRRANAPPAGEDGEPPEGDADPVEALAADLGRASVRSYARLRALERRVETLEGLLR